MVVLHLCGHVRVHAQTVALPFTHVHECMCGYTPAMPSFAHVHEHACTRPMVPFAHAYEHERICTSIVLPFTHVHEHARTSPVLPFAHAHECICTSIVLPFAHVHERARPTQVPCPHLRMCTTVHAPHKRCAAIHACARAQGLPHLPQLVRSVKNVGDPCSTSPPSSVKFGLWIFESALEQLAWGKSQPWFLRGILAQADQGGSMLFPQILWTGPRLEGCAKGTDVVVWSAGDGGRDGLLVKEI